MSRNTLASPGIVVELSALSADYVRVRETADLTSSGVLVSRQHFSAFMAGALSGEVRPVELGDLALVRIGDLTERSPWLVTTRESWDIFLTRATQGELDDFILRRRM
ncbi:hypothetical protein [Spongiactinospora rosea]|nr:hypothetical protein [Spongiactinospora rosea]